jgi:metal-sulfur cluster biosynthetic enzyme
MSNSVKEEIREALQDVYDPELYVDVITLGLIYDIEPKDEGAVDIEMTFTFPGCPYGPELVEQVEDAILDVEDVDEVEVDVTFEPRWTPDQIDDDVRAAIGM